jgi:hypothetical protein
MAKSLIEIKSQHVDLNPIRAAMAQTPAESVHTSAYDRIGGLQGQKLASAAADRIVIPTEEAGKVRRESPPDQLRQRRAQSRPSRRGRAILRDAWLAPLTLDERGPSGAQASTTKVRASDKGFLTMSLKDHLSLLTWTGSNRPLLGKHSVPVEVEPILKQLGIDGSMWIDLVWRFKKYFGGSAAGSPESLARDAAKHQHVGGVARARCGRSSRRDRDLTAVHPLLIFQPSVASMLKLAPRPFWRTHGKGAVGRVCLP